MDAKTNRDVLRIFQTIQRSNGISPDWHTILRQVLALWLLKSLLEGLNMHYWRMLHVLLACICTKQTVFAARPIFGLISIGSPPVYLKYLRHIFPSLSHVNSLEPGSLRCYQPQLCVVTSHQRICQGPLYNSLSHCCCDTPFSPRIYNYESLCCRCHPRCARMQGICCDGMGPVWGSLLYW